MSEEIKPAINIGIEKKAREEFVLVRPNKSMSVQELLEEMKKQGMRALTLDEMQNILDKSKPGKIEPKDSDIVIKKGNDKTF